MRMKYQMKSTLRPGFTIHELKDIARSLPLFSRPFGCRSTLTTFYKHSPPLIDIGLFPPHLLSRCTRIPEMNIYLSLLAEKAKDELSLVIWLQYLLLIHLSKVGMRHGVSNIDLQGKKSSLLDDNDSST